jgi:hypothetical protein
MNVKRVKIELTLFTASHCMEKDYRMEVSCLIKDRSVLQDDTRGGVVAGHLPFQRG